MISKPILESILATIIVAMLLSCSCESKEEKAYKIAMHSNDLTEVRNFLRDFEEEASGDEVNNAKDEIKRLEADSSLYAQITASNVLEERIKLEDSYLQLKDPVHEKEITALYEKDTDFIKKHKDKNTNNSQQEQTKAESSTTEGVGTLLAEVIGNKVSNYIAKREINKYFKNYIFEGNLLGICDVKMVFSPIGSNYTGTGFFLAQTGDWIKFSYASIGDGKLEVLAPTGDRGTLRLYKNGIEDDGGNFCKKFYDPATYQYFFGR